MPVNIFSGPEWKGIPQPNVPVASEKDTVAKESITINDLSNGLFALIKNIEAGPGTALSDLILVNKELHQSLLDKEKKTAELAREFGRNQRSLIEELGRRDKEIDDLKSKLVAANAQIAATKEDNATKSNRSAGQPHSQCSETSWPKSDTLAFTKWLFELTAQHSKDPSSMNTAEAALAVEFASWLEQQQDQSVRQDGTGHPLSSSGAIKHQSVSGRGRKRRHRESDRDESSSCEESERRHSSRTPRDRNRHRHRSSYHHRDRSSHTGRHHRGYRYEKDNYSSDGYHSDTHSRSREDHGMSFCGGHSLVVYGSRQNEKDRRDGGMVVRYNRQPQRYDHDTLKERVGSRILDLSPWIQVSAVEQLVTRSKTNLRALFFVFLDDSIKMDETLSRVLGGRVESIIWKERAVGTDKRTAFVNFIDSFEAESYLRYTQVNPGHLHHTGNAQDDCPEVSVQWASRSGVVKFYLASAILVNGATRLLRVNGVPKSINYQDIWELVPGTENSFRFVHQSAVGADTFDYTLEFASISEAMAARSRLFQDKRLKNCGFLWVTNKTDSAVDLFTKTQLGQGSLLKVGSKTSVVCG